MPQGQTQFNSAGEIGGYMVRPNVRAELFHESRQKSIVGKMSMLATSAEDVGNGPYSGKNLDAAAILSKTVVTGDEWRFHLAQRLDGSAVFGDRMPPPGDYQAFLNATVKMNIMKCPAIPLVEKMSRQRILEVLKEGELTSEIKSQIVSWFADQYTFDFWSTILTGASPSLRAPKADGGLAYNVGRGPSLQVAPQHFVVAGSGYVQGVSGTDAYEEAVATALSSLDNDSSKQPSLQFLHALDNSLTARGILPLTGTAANDGNEEWVVACDPDLLVGLTKPGGDLWTAYRDARERGRDNPVFKNESIKIGRLRLVPEEALKAFRPKVVNDLPVWGKDDVANDRRGFVSDSQIGLMVVIGRHAVIEAAKGDIEFTYDAGKHGVGANWSANTMNGFTRTRWEAKDGRPLSNTSLIERGVAVAALSIPSISL